MRKRTFVIYCILTVVLLLLHWDRSLEPTYTAFSMAGIILFGLIIGIMLLVKKERKKSIIVTYIVLVCAIIATVYFTFDKITMNDLLIDSDDESITSVQLRSQDGNRSWSWYPSEDQVLSDRSTAEIHGGSAEEVLSGLSEITIQNYCFGSAELDPVIEDISIYTSGGNRISIYEGYNNSYSVRVNGRSLRGKWIFSQPISDYIPAEILESVCSE